MAQIQQGLLNHIPHSAFRIRYDNSQRQRRNQMPRFLHTDEVVPHLGAISMGNNDPMPQPEELHHPFQTAAGIGKLLVNVALFRGLCNGISAEGHDDGF